MVDKKLIDLVNSFSKLYYEKKAALPYHINVIDELWANENSHSRILVKLLQSEQNNYQILNSFMSLLSEKCSELENKKSDILKPTINAGKGQIDALIEEENKYAIIIENKIHWAVDQKQQIDRYVEAVQNRGFGRDSKNVFVVYLTRDGFKQVSDSSFSEAKEFLDYIGEKNTGRFIPIDYRNDILPWLENEILPNCQIKDDYLISALKQYIDHLKGLFNLRENEKNMTKEILKTLFEEDIDNLDKIKEKLKEVENLRDALNVHIENLNNNHISKLFYKIKEKLREQKISLEESNWGAGKGFSFQKNLDLTLHKSNEKLCLIFQYSMQNKELVYGLGIKGAEKPIGLDDDLKLESYKRISESFKEINPEALQKFTTGWLVYCEKQKINFFDESFVSNQVELISENYHAVTQSKEMS